MGKPSRYTVQLHSLLKAKYKTQQPGFTLIEMLVIAPLVLLVIAGLISAMVAMIGDSLIANSRVNTAYGIQDSLSQIEQDTRVSTNFMGTFSYFSSPQGRDGSTAAFSYSSNKDLILTQQATTTSPYNTTRDLVYYADQPAACGSGVLSGNRTLATRVIYFLVSNSNGTKTLWRRTIVNPWDVNSTHDGNTVCGTPWQRDSCSQGNTISNTPSSTCQSVDQKMVDNVTDFTPTFYDSWGDVVTDPTQADTVSVSITVQQNVSGKTISQTSVIRANRRNDVPAIPVPDTPTVSIYNPGVAIYNNPILTTFQWLSNNAYTYLVSTQINGGSWSTPQSMTGTTLGVSAPPGATINIKVTAVNDSGNSATTTYSTTQDIFTDMDLEGSWTSYSSTNWYSPSFTRTTAGVVELRGLVKNGSGTITTLPTGFRPSKRVILTTLSGSSNSIARVDVDTDGTVTWMAGGDNSWVSLDGLNFMSSSFDASTNWTYPTLLCPSGCTTAWTNYSGGTSTYGKLQTGVDGMGRAQVYGILSTPSPYPPANYSSIATLGSAYSVSTNDIYPDLASSNVFASYGVISNTLQFRTNLGVSWKTFAAMYYPSGSSASWTSIPLSNSWVPYNSAGSGYSQPQFTESADHIVTVRGLVKSGTVTSGTTIGTLPSGAHPATRLIFVVAGYNGTAEIPVRLDILTTGAIIINFTGAANNYLSLANISFYQDGN
jgi:hypothetical protein